MSAKKKRSTPKSKAKPKPKPKAKAKAKPQAKPKSKKASSENLVSPKLTLLELVAFVVDRASPKPAVAVAAGRLLEIREEGRTATPANARLIIETLFQRRSSLPRAVVDRVIKGMSSAEAFELISPELAKNTSSAEKLADLLIEKKDPSQPAKLLRDPRWLPFLVEHDFYSEQAMKLAIARDADNPSRDEALAIFLASEKEKRKDVIGRRWAIEAIGKTGHPGAVPVLIAAIKDRHIGSAMALTLNALAQCATLETIPFLKTRLKKLPTWTSYIEEAITTIEKRARELSRDRIIQACTHSDPTIAKLARSARDGDPASKAVLEDALRERGELPS